jgi:hypothetical protein
VDWLEQVVDEAAVAASQAAALRLHHQNLKTISINSYPMYINSPEGGAEASNASLAVEALSGNRKCPLDR